MRERERMLSANSMDTASGDGLSVGVLPSPEEEPPHPVRIRATMIDEKRANIFFLPLNFID
jgi:hypothetical protein